MRNVITKTSAAVLFIALTISSLCSRSDAAAVDFYEATVLAASPEVYWRLGEGSTASPAANLGTQGAGANGVYGSTTTLGNAGPLFNSTNTAAGFASGVTTSNVINSPFAFPGGSFSSEFWVNTSVTGATQGLVSYNSSAENDFLAIISASNSLNFILSGATTFTTGINVSDGSWHHIVSTWDITSGDFEVYKDGASVASMSGYQTGIGRVTGGSLALGQEQDNAGAGAPMDPNQAFTGFLDEFALFGTVLSPAEVLLHYNVGVGNVLPPVPEPSSLLLLGLGALGLVRHTRRRRRRA